MNAVSLFAGVGGFDLALERAGVPVVAVVEWDKAAQGVLAHQFPNTKLFGDIQEVTGNELRAAGFIPESGIITGGFPCQDLSVAGKRAGLEGNRSGLFWEICRLLDDLQPKWFVLENVPGLLSSNGGRDMGTVLEALANRGYGVAYRVLDAQFFGVPQRRRRIFIVGCLGDSGRASAEILALTEGLRGHSQTSEQAGKDATEGTGSGAPIATLRSGGAGGIPSSRGEHLVVTPPPPIGELISDTGSRQHSDDRDRNPLRPRHRIIGRDVVGTLSGGAHPGGLNGQDAYSGHLVVCEIKKGTEQ